MKSPRDYAREYRAHQAPAAYARYCPACGGFGVPQNQDACRFCGAPADARFPDPVELPYPEPQTALAI